MVTSAVKERLRKLRQKFGLGEYRNKKKLRVLSKPKRPKRTKRRMMQMVKRRRSSSSKGSFGGNAMLTRGIIKPTGLIQSALVGAGAASLQEKVVPQVLPLQGVAAGFIVGGIGGAAGAYARQLLGGQTGSISNSAYDY